MKKECKGSPRKCGRNSEFRVDVNVFISIGLSESFWTYKFLILPVADFDLGRWKWFLSASRASAGEMRKLSGDSRSTHGLRLRNLNSGVAFSSGERALQRAPERRFPEGYAWPGSHSAWILRENIPDGENPSDLD